MKKIIIVVIVLIILAAAGVAGYFFFIQDDGKSDPRPPKDLTGIIVPPVEFPMKGKTFMVPNSSTTQAVVLDLVSPTAKRDYPMGRFSDSVGSISTLVAQDDFATPAENNIRAVPIVVSRGETNQTYYLAILEGDEMTHIASLLIGDMIKIQSVTRSGNTVTVNYLVHDRLQELTELPKVPTTAILDIATKQIIQAGRVPKNEEYIETKAFAGEYLWRETVTRDGKKVTPGKSDTFTLLFDANRISLGTDCNSGSATFVASSGSSTKFTIEPIAQTKMFCESAQEGEYFAMIAKVTNYGEASDGTLTFTLGEDGIMVFEPKVKKLEFAATSTKSQ